MLFVTNSAFIEFTSSAERYAFPLVPGYQDGPVLLTSGQAWLLLIEADGYLYLAQNAKYCCLDVAPYERFDYAPNSAVQVCFAPPDAVIVSSLFFAGYSTVRESDGSFKDVYGVSFSDGTRVAYGRPHGLGPEVALPVPGVLKARLADYQLSVYPGGVQPGVPDS